MKTYAITGGIGSGKSTLKHWFEKHNIPTLDADQIAREQVQPGQPALAAIAKTFGADFMLKDGHLDREALRQKIFSDQESKTTLESILHPLIRQATAKKLQVLADEGHTIAVVEIPLLIETGKPDYIDKVILSDCSPSQQIARVQRRSHWRYEDIANVMKQQTARKDRYQHADIIIDTSADLTSVELQLQHHFPKL
ncbi:dephospho-CoA kinase [Hydrogenovibrio kuenenii]|uniref:dephospho-CoA kinase n=1 Tax=Hydrogenovibrio kuenenii TaxID=63658 RepID=UPI0004651FE5|nr:dephospho-CoA kinase [Hydrogenovibrio kuenenii]